MIAASKRRSLTCPCPDRFERLSGVSQRVIARNETKSHSRDMVGWRGCRSPSQPRYRQEGASCFECRCVLCRCCVCCAVLLAACGGGSAGSAGGSSSGKLQVVAAENFWGSIASAARRQQGRGESIIVNPNTDPHSYEPTASDGVALAKSQMAIVNGIGYDAWASKLIAANPSSCAEGRSTSGICSGSKEGDNPHQWYSPSSRAAGDRSDRRRLQAAGPEGRARTSIGSAAAFETRALAGYNRLIAADPRALCRGAGGLQREHLPAARRGARAEAADAVQLREGDRRGDRRERGRQADGRSRRRNGA